MSNTKAKSRRAYTAQQKKLIMEEFRNSPEGRQYEKSLGTRYLANPQYRDDLIWSQAQRMFERGGSFANRVMTNFERKMIERYPAHIHGYPVETQSSASQRGQGSTQSKSSSKASSNSTSSNDLGLRDYVGTGYWSSGNSPITTPARAEMKARLGAYDRPNMRFVFGNKQGSVVGQGGGFLNHRGEAFYYDRSGNASVDHRGRAIGTEGSMAKDGTVTSRRHGNAETNYDQRGQYAGGDKQFRKALSKNNSTYVENYNRQQANHYGQGTALRSAANIAGRVARNLGIVGSAFAAKDMIDIAEHIYSDPYMAGGTRQFDGSWRNNYGDSNTANLWNYVQEKNGNRAIDFSAIARNGHIEVSPNGEILYYLGDPRQLGSDNGSAFGVGMGRRMGREAMSPHQARQLLPHLGNFKDPKVREAIRTLAGTANTADDFVVTAPRKKAEQPKPSAGRGDGGGSWGGGSSGGGGATGRWGGPEPTPVSPDQTPVLSPLPIPGMTPAPSPSPVMPIAPPSRSIEEILGDRLAPIRRPDLPMPAPRPVHPIAQPGQSIEDIFAEDLMPNPIAADPRFSSSSSSVPLPRLPQGRLDILPHNLFEQYMQTIGYGPHLKSSTPYIAPANALDLLNFRIR